MVVIEQISKVIIAKKSTTIESINTIDTNQKGKIKLLKIPTFFSSDTNFSSDIAIIIENAANKDQIIQQTPQLKQ